MFVWVPRPPWRTLWRVRERRGKLSKNAARIFDFRLLNHFWRKVIGWFGMILQKMRKLICGGAMPPNV